MNEYEPSPSQVLLIWRLAGLNGEAWLADITPAALGKKLHRDSLLRAGLIDEETRRRERAGKRATRGTYITLTDEGWAWLAEHLDAPVSKRGRAAADVLEMILRKLKVHLRGHRIALADFITGEPEAGAPASPSLEPHSAQPASADPAATPTAPQLDLSQVIQRIRSTYARLADNRPGARVRLADLRRELADISRSQLDQALEQMTRAGSVVLNRLDNPAEISPADDEAKILTELGDPRHIMHMELTVHA